MNNCEAFGCRYLVTKCERCGRTANEIIMPTAEWIRAEEKVPEIDEPVLVWSPKKYEGPNIGYYDPYSSPKTKWRCAEFMDISVTHWMPLPEPPNEVD